MRDITETFDSPIGQLSEWFERTGAAWPADNKHVDLRSFYNYGVERRRTQEELSTYTQSGLENPPLGTMRSIESAIAVSGEFWSVTGTGVVNSYDWLSPPPSPPAGSPVIGPNATLANWRAMELTTTTAAWAADLVSSIPLDSSIPDTQGIDISSDALGGGAALSLTISGDFDRSSFTAATSYIQLSSAADGGFGVAADCTATASGVFTGNTSAIGTELRIPMATLLASAGADFDPTKVRGVKIHLVKGSGSAGQKVRIAALRVVGSSWTVKDYDMETRRGVLVRPVSLDLAPQTQSSILVRGTDPNDGEDAKFVDGTTHIFFSAGGAAVESVTDNTLAFVVREDEASDTALVAYFKWDNNSILFGAHRFDDFDGTPTPVGSRTQSYAIDLLRATDDDLVNGYGINSEVGRYCLQLTLAGNNVELRLFKANSQNVIKGAALAAFDVTDTYYLSRRGRVGIYADLPDRDVFVDALEPGVTGYATIRTLAFSSYTPVDGAQLVAAFSQGENLFREFLYLNPEETFLDSTKTLSGLGSWRTKTGLLAQQFLIEDWNHTKIEFDIWVGATVRPSNQPFMLLTASELDELGDPIEVYVPLPQLRANQWNHIELDMARFANLHSGLFYTMVIQPQDTELGYFWIESMNITRRLIDWQARAATDAPWRSFRDLVNDSHGALHFAQAERGRKIQLQGIALTPEAWVARLRLLPRYAELGNPLFDEGFQKG